MERFDEELELLLKCKTPIIEVVTTEWQDFNLWQA